MNESHSFGDLIGCGLISQVGQDGVGIGEGGSRSFASGDVTIDGDKRTYVDAYEMALAVTRTGGFILIDNTLWDGHVVDSAYDRDAQTLGVRRLNDHVADDQRVEKVILPLRDGLTLIRKVGLRPNVEC